jgi:acylaminoacyl-peptidase
MTGRTVPVFFSLLLVSGTPAIAQAPADLFEPADVFELERVTDPRISPDGSQVAYVRAGADVMTDRSRTSIWVINVDGSEHRPIATGSGGYSQPRWSPDGRRLAYVVTVDERAQIFVRWMDTGQEAQLTNLTQTPQGLSWSPDGRWIAFSMFVADDPGTLEAAMPEPPEGADWGPAIEVIDALAYRADGQGYTEEGNTQVFVLPADGGTPRQVTAGPYNHAGNLEWTPDGGSLVFSANRHPGGAREQPLNSELFTVSLEDGALAQLTDRYGPDGSPRVSPAGDLIAYTGFDDEHQGYQVTELYLTGADGRGSRPLTPDLDRDVQGVRWAADGSGLFFQYDDRGNTKIAFVNLDGEVTDLTADVGGLSLGRPYSGGQFTVAGNGTVAFTLGRPDHPADLAVVEQGAEARRLTELNDDLLGHKTLGRVEEIWFESSYDGRPVQGWIVKPPGFDPSRQYPLILEIHGGPFANYGDRFAAEVQLYAAAGYVVLYVNPRGSTSYGREFGNLIHHNYPGQDYDDLMSGVDAVVSQGYVDESNLFVTGGSGGGVLSAWIVGHTKRFRAAAVQKPVINWYSFVLNADGLPFFYKYWFPGPPWEHEAHYMARSPISKVGNVTTPTMLITGEEDYRTPMSETEQFYGALQIQGVDATMVRIPDASHGIASRSSNLIAKVQFILGWFDEYRLAERPVS